MIPRWYWIALGLVLGVGLAVVLLVAITESSADAWTEIAVGVAPILVLGVAGAVRLLRSRRR